MNAEWSCFKQPEDSQHLFPTFQLKFSSFWHCLLYLHNNFLYLFPYHSFYVLQASPTGEDNIQNIPKANPATTSAQLIARWATGLPFLIYIHVGQCAKTKKKKKNWYAFSKVFLPEVPELHALSSFDTEWTVGIIFIFLPLRQKPSISLNLVLLSNQFFFFPSFYVWGCVCILLQHETVSKNPLATFSKSLSFNVISSCTWLLLSYLTRMNIPFWCVLWGTDPLFNLIYCPCVLPEWE